MISDSLSPFEPDSLAVQRVHALLMVAVGLAVAAAVLGAVPLLIPQSCSPKPQPDRWLWATWAIFIRAPLLITGSLVTFLVGLVKVRNMAGWTHRNRWIGLFTGLGILVPTLAAVAVLAEVGLAVMFGVANSLACH